MTAQDEAISKAVNRAYDFAIETFRQIIDVEVAKAKKEMITAVLEIIDELCTDEDNGKMIAGRMVYILASEFRDRILALQGGEQE